MSYIYLLILSCCLCFTSNSYAYEQQKSTPKNILFVGNSLTYVNNLPALFDSWAKHNQHHTHSYMLVEGGATLTERWQDQKVAQALSKRRYDVVILQERGGDVIGSFGEQAQIDAEQGVLKLRDLIYAHGAKVIYLGTYQPHPATSKILHTAEFELTKKLGVNYVAITPYLEVGLKHFPKAPWLHTDRAHPGPLLSLLDAMALYRHLFGVENEVRAFTMNAPVFGTSAGLALEVLDSQTVFSSKKIANKLDFAESDVEAVRKAFSTKP